MESSVKTSVVVSNKILNKLNKSHVSESSLSAIIFFTCLFFINPLIAIGGLFVYLCGADYKRQTNILLILFVSIYNGCINSTKLPENDLVWYLEFFDLAGRENLATYIFGLSNYSVGMKEPLFAVYNYVIYYIVNGSRDYYLIVHSAICYILMCISILRFGDALGFTKFSKLFAVLLMAFTPFIFTISAHLMRQFLASSILIYILTSIYIRANKTLFLMVVMTMIHSTTLLFVPFILAKRFLSKITKNNIFYYVLCFLFIFYIQSIAQLGLRLFGFFPIYSDALARASGGTKFELGELSFAKILVTTFVGILPTFLLFFGYKKNKSDPNLVYISNILIFLVFFILLNLHQQELAGRFIFYIWIFFPYVFMLTVNQFKFPSINYIFMLFPLMYFYTNYIATGPWTYKIGDYMIMNTLFFYLL